MAKYEVTLYEVMAVKIFVDATDRQDAIEQAIELNNDGQYEDGTPIDGVYDRTSDEILVVKLYD